MEVVQKHLFAEEVLPPAETDDGVTILSAPGESRECMEIARLVQREARAGVSFDKMAVLPRAPGLYRALLEEAFSRAGIPAHFAQGTVGPDPAGKVPSMKPSLALILETVLLLKFATHMLAPSKATPSGLAPVANAAV